MSERTKLFFRTIIFLLIVSFYTGLPVFAASHSEISTTIIQDLSDKDIVLKEFKEIYSRFLVKAQNGEIIQKYMDEADLIAIELKKSLIENQARVESLKLDTLVKEKRENAVENLITLSAEHEREKISYLSQLKALEKQAVEFDDVAQSSEPSKLQSADFEIEIKAEDITKGTRE
jgi:hypothetical protein